MSYDMPATFSAASGATYRFQGIGTVECIANYLFGPIQGIALNNHDVNDFMVGHTQLNPI